MNLFQLEDILTALKDRRHCAGAACRVEPGWLVLETAVAGPAGWGRRVQRTQSSQGFAPASPPGWRGQGKKSFWKLLNAPWPPGR